MNRALLPFPSRRNSRLSVAVSMIALTDELVKIEQHLDPTNCTEGLTTVAVFGLGGVGKPSLASAYTEQSKANKIYDAIL